MSISPSNVELSMYTAVLQAQTAIGGILQRGLGIQIDSIKCLEPNSWNKLEIPDRLNGEGIAVAIMAQQGGYLLFISDDGILLPAGYGTTLNDPTQPLPIMANQLQRELQPDAPEYVGKRIGKAKVFSSMARRSGVDNTAQILPINLDIGGQESIIWFIGTVPHPERAFAKRNPIPESKSKKSKLFSDEILANFTVSSDILSPSPDSSLPTEETIELLDESSSDINNKSERHKADLGRLLALKSAAVEENYDWQRVEAKDLIDYQEEKKEEQNALSPLPSDEIIPSSESVDCLQDDAVSDQTLASTVQSSLFTSSCPVDVEKDVVIVQGDALPEDIYPEVDTAEDDAPQNDDAEVDAAEEDVPQNDDSEVDAAEEDATQNDDSEVDAAEEDAPQNDDAEVDAAEEDVPQNDDSEVDAAEEDAPQNDDSEVDAAEEDVLDNTSELTTPYNSKRYTVHSAHNNYPAAAHQVPLPPHHPALKMPISLDAVISRRNCLIQDILSWKPGKIIEFDEIQPTITLESNGVVLGRGKPINQNLRIGIQLE